MWSFGLDSYLNKFNSYSEDIFNFPEKDPKIANGFLKSARFLNSSFLIHHIFDFTSKCLW